MTFPRHSLIQHTDDPNMGAVGNHRRQELPSLIPGGEIVAYRLSGEQETCSDGHLSDIMPDVAMATASLGQLQIGDVPESLHLDLGDGPSHMYREAAAIGLHNIPVSIYKIS